MSNCYRTSNNKFLNAPPRMADGRHFTDYRPNCFINNRIKVDNKLVNSYDYRMFLTRNADKLIELNQKNTFIMNGNFECKEPYNQGTMLPEQDKVVCNIQTCNVETREYHKTLSLAANEEQQGGCSIYSNFDLCVFAQFTDVNYTGNKQVLTKFELTKLIIHTKKCSKTSTNS